MYIRIVTTLSDLLYTIKYCIEAAAYVHFFDFLCRPASMRGRLRIKTGIFVAVVHLLPTYTVQNMHVEIQQLCFHCMTPYTIHTIKSRIYKPRLLVSCVGYAAFIQRLYNIWSTIYIKSSCFPDYYNKTKVFSARRVSDEEDQG